MSAGTSSKPRYLLTCECGQTHRVDTSQAGETLACVCGRALEIPTLRGLRQLPPVEKEQVSAPKPTWNRAQGLWFAGGLLTATIALALGGILLFTLVQIDVSAPEYDFDREARASLQGLAPEELWDAWNDARQKGLGPYETPRHVQMRQWRDELTIGAVVAAVIGVSGLVAAAAAVLMQKPRTGKS